MKNADVVFEERATGGYTAKALTPNGERFLRLPNQQKPEAWYRKNGTAKELYLPDDLALDVISELADSWGNGIHCEPGL